MAYLNNADQTLTLILTDKAKRKIAESGVNSLNITKFALGDDEINYDISDNNTLEDILETSIQSPNPNSDVAIKFHLVTREIGSIEAVPIITTGSDTYNILYGSKVTISPEISNISATKYSTTFNFSFDKTTGIGISVDRNTVTSAKSMTYNGKEITISNTGVRSNTTITMTIKDNTSGATKNITLTVVAKSATKTPTSAL